MDPWIVLFSRQAMMDRLVAFTEQISKGTADVRVARWSGGLTIVAYQAGKPPWHLPSI